MLQIYLSQEWGSLEIRGPDHSDTVNDTPAKNTVLMCQKAIMCHSAAVAKKGLQRKKTCIIENGIP